MRHELPKSSFRQDGATAMAGAIFIANTATRDLCFRANIFGLPIEYQPFVDNIKQGMPLFLFDYTDRNLYGVFEAASDGGLNINRSAYISTGYSYPAQVCFKIVWKCRPLTEDEFSLVIEENYYMPKKFYFDLSYKQVVELYWLFDEKRVKHPICKISRKETPEKRRLSPNIHHLSADHADILLPSSTHQVVPQPNVLMPLGTSKPFGVHIAPEHNNYHGQAELPYFGRVLLPEAATADAIATEVTTHCSQTTKYHQYQLSASQSYSLPLKYPDNLLPSGSVACGPTYELKNCANHPYLSSLGYAGSFPLSPGSKTQDTTGGGINNMNSTFTSHVPSYPLFHSANPQGSATHWKDHYDTTGGGINNMNSTFTSHVPSYLLFHSANPQGSATNWKDHYDAQCRSGPPEDIYSPELCHFSKIKALTPPLELSQLDIPVYPEIPESAIDQRKESFADEDFENAQPKHGFNCNATVSSGLDNSMRAYMSGHLYKGPDITSETKTTAPGQRAQCSVFSRLSLKQPSLSQEISGPSFNQLVHSLSQRTQQWSKKDKIITNDVCKQLVSEQVIDIQCPLSELNQPGLTEEEEIAGLPFLNFKRRGETRNLDTNLGKEISGKVKRRKLIRPSFGEDNNTASSGKELQDNNGLEERKHSHVEHDGKKFCFDLNMPASTDDDLANEDDTTVLCPSVVTKIHREKPCEANSCKPNCSNATEEINKQDPSFDSATHTEKVSLDLSVADLNTADELKLQLNLTPLLSQALDKLLRSGKLNNNSEEAIPTIDGKDRNTDCFDEL
ncbi:hypothetical protein GUJ93_ZPchr0002g23000 [Zizania palustris]|uniref:DCD domain-containing protein n=1 Tax=Zizania palustris TaxID=103762 RepID=A0A8J5VRL4_ZIZPA|nr:hypothetical protein GUJ93_ZPchr0002g23000 [Zizania palustris]